MISYRKSAIIVGVLFIIGDIAGVLSYVVTGGLLDGPDALTKIAASQNHVVLGALLVLVMGLALAMVPVLMFPVFKKYNEVLALGCVVFRGALETVAYMACAGAWLLLVELSREHAEAASDLVGRALAQIGGKMRAVSRAAAIAEHKNLPVLRQDLLECANHPGHFARRNGIQRGFLGRHIIV